MTNAIAKLVHCPTCGSPPGRACRPLNPEKTFIVPNHAARRRLYEEQPRHTAMAFAIEQAGYVTKLEFRDGRRFEYEPPVRLVPGVKYAVDLGNGALLQHITGDHIEYVARAKGQTFTARERR